MTWTTGLLAGVAQLLHDAGAGVWRGDGTAYTATETGIYITQAPPEPDTAIVLAAYPADDTDDGGSGVLQAIQAITRAGTTDTTAVIALDDAVTDALHGITNRAVGGVHITRMWRQSGAPIGPDAAGRHQISSNYYANAARHTPLRSE